MIRRRRGLGVVVCSLMDPIAVHVTTARFRRQASIPRDVLIQLVQADMRCAGADAIAAVDQLVQEGYVVESTEHESRIFRRGPNLREVPPAS